MGKMNLVEWHAEADPGALLARLKGPPAGEEPDAATTTAFCALLSGYTFKSYAENLASPDNTPLPRGYRNVRVVDRRDGALLGSLWWLGTGPTPETAGIGFRCSHSRPTAQDIISICLCMPLEEITAWRSTIARPCQEPGTLDLVVDIDTRPRELLMIDGSPLAPEIVTFLALRAPAKARRRGRES